MRACDSSHIRRADIRLVDSASSSRFLFRRPPVLVGGVIVLAFSTARLWPESTDVPVFATWERPEDAASLLSRADAAMYDRKNERAAATQS